MVEVSCIFAAICFMAANVMKIIFFVNEHKRSHFDWETYKTLDPDYLQEEWDFRISKKGIFLASGFLNAIAWMVFAYPIIQMAWLLSKQGKQGISINISIMILALGGAITEWLSSLFWIGMNVASTHLVQKFNLDDWLRDDLGSPTDGMGWRALEVTHIDASGFIWFTDAFEWICLSGIFILTFVSVRQWRMQDQTSFGARWNGLGLFIGLLCVMEFVSEILRFEGFRIFGPIALVYSILNRLLLIPAWIISLGFLLPRVTAKQAYYANNHINSSGNPVDSELALTEMKSEVEPAFTIGDEDAADDGEQQVAATASPPLEAFVQPPE
jgi:hypothetical protein